MNILMVENSVNLARQLGYILIPMGIRGFITTSRDQAMEVLKANEDITIAIVDVDNQVLGGFEMIKEISAMRDGAFKFILHSALEYDDLAGKVPGAAILGHLVKPFDEARIKAALKILFSSIINGPSKIDVPEGKERRKHIRVTPPQDELLRVHFRVKSYSHLLAGRILNISTHSIAVQLFNPAAADILTEGTEAMHAQFTVNCRMLTLNGVIILKRGKILVIVFRKIDEKSMEVLAKYIFDKISREFSPGI